MTPDIHLYLYTTPECAMSRVLDFIARIDILRIISIITDTSGSTVVDLISSIASASVRADRIHTLSIGAGIR